MKKVDYVVVGFGGIAENRVAKEGFACDTGRFRPLKRARLVGATDLNQGRRAAAEALGLRWYPSYDDVLGDKSVDAVYIATNNRSHVPLALKALKAGKHVLVEKPMATTLADARKLNRTAKSKGLSLAVDHMMVNNAYNILGRDLIAKGRLGKVNDGCFHLEYAYGYTPEEAAEWRCNNVAEMGGPIGDVGSHCLYVAEFMLGKTVKKVAAVYYPKILPIRAEDGAYIKMVFADGTQASVRAAFSEFRGGETGTLTNLGWEVYGDRATLRGYGTLFQFSGHADEPIRMRVELDDGHAAKVVRPERIRNIYQEQIERHARSIQEGRPLTGDEAVHNLALCAACHESARKGGKTIVLKQGNAQAVKNRREK